jgi:cytochrome P450
LNANEKTPGGSTHSLAYIPFLLGPRGCIGQVFAKAEMRCLLAAYVERFQWEMFDPTEELAVAGVVRIVPFAMSDC